MNKGNPIHRLHFQQNSIAQDIGAYEYIDIIILPTHRAIRLVTPITSALYASSQQDLDDQARRFK